MSDHGDEQHEHHEHDENERPAFVMPVPVELGEFFGQQRDRRQMQGVEMRTKINNFIDGLDVDQLLALRYMLNMCTPCSCGDHHSVMTSEYFDGQIVSILRLIHHVNPESGESLEEELSRPGVKDPEA